VVGFFVLPLFVFAGLAMGLGAIIGLIKWVRNPRYLTEDPRTHWLRSTGKDLSPLQSLLLFVGMLSLSVIMLIGPFGVILGKPDGWVSSSGPAGITLIAAACVLGVCVLVGVASHVQLRDPHHNGTRSLPTEDDTPRTRESDEQWSRRMQEQ
jgi:hypothetical protein